MVRSLYVVVSATGFLLQRDILNPTIDHCNIAAWGFKILRVRKGRKFDQMEGTKAAKTLHYRTAAKKL
jgi:hypothetical protein